LIKNINDKIYIIEEYISNSTSKFITQIFDKNLEDTPNYQIKGGPAIGPERGYITKCGNPIIKYTGNDEEDLASDILTMICLSMSDTVSTFLNKKMDIKTMFYGVMLEGSENKIHVDNYGDIDNEDSLRLNSKDDWSGLLYLNDEYEGGILEFPREKFSIKPKTGTFIFFKGSHDLPHGVSKVEKGKRNTIVSFFWPAEYRGLELF
jgi:hypothetical protein